MKPILTLAFALLLCGSAQAGCRPCVKQVHQVYAAPIVQPVLSYYRVAPQYGEPATAEYYFRQSEGYQELIATKAELAGVQKTLQALAAINGAYVQDPNAPPTPEAQSPNPEALPAQPSPPPAGNPKWETFKQQFPVLSQHCSNCHGIKNPDNPDGGLYLNGEMDLADRARRDLIIEKVRTGEMPPSLEEGHRLPPDVIEAISDELYGVSVTSSN